LKIWKIMTGFSNRKWYYQKGNGVTDRKSI